MQWDISVILLNDFKRLLDHLIAFGRIRLNEHLGGKFIDLLVAVAAEIRLTAIDFRIVAAAQDLVDKLVRI
jgi:hypothetical protein